MDSNLEDGRLPSGAGLSPDGRAPAGLAGSATSIPDAAELQARLSSPEFQRQQAVELLAAKVGFAFKCARIRRGLTQQELAAKSGCSVALVRRLESGQYLEGLRMIGRWAYELDVEIDFKIRPRPAIAMETRQGGDSEAAPSQSDDSAGREASPVSSRLSDTEGR